MAGVHPTAVAFPEEKNPNCSESHHLSFFILKPYSTVLIALLSVAHIFFRDKETVCSSGLFVAWQNQARLRLSPDLSLPSKNNVYKLPCTEENT